MKETELSQRAPTWSAQYVADQSDLEACIAQPQLPWNGPTLVGSPSGPVVYSKKRKFHTEAEIASTDKNHRRSLAELAKIVGEKDARVLLRAKDVLLRWLRGSPQQSFKFLADPLAPLEKFDVKLKDSHRNGLVSH